MMVVNLISKGIMTTCQRRETGIHRKSAGTDSGRLEHLVNSPSHFENIGFYSRPFAPTSIKTLKPRLNLKGGARQRF